MESFAIWYDEKHEYNQDHGEEQCNNYKKRNKKQKEKNKCNEMSKCKDEEPKLTLNFNLWRLDEVYQNTSLKMVGKLPLFRQFLHKKKCSDINKCNYILDIGMKIKQIEKIEKIYLYVPFKINQNNIKDLGQIMIQNKKVIDGIFNENSKISKDGYENAIEVKVLNEEIKIFKLDFEWQHNISLEERKNDTIIIINVSGFKAHNRSSYIRFRIQGPELNKLIQSKKIKDNPFKTYSESNDIIDFRLNEKRSMPDGLVNLMNSKKEFKIEAIHFLLLMDIKYKLAATGLNYTARALETDLWNQYLECEIKDLDMVGYHWKQKYSKDINSLKYVENFNSLIRIEEKKCDLKTIFGYISVLGIINLITSFLYEEWFKSFLKYILKKIFVI